MGRIFLEGKSASVFGVEVPRQHLYLVYRADDGQEYVIRGGPSTSGGDGALDVLWNDVLLADSPDRRGAETPRSRGQIELQLGERDADQVWSLLKQYAQIVDDESLQYSGLGHGEGEPGYNSNAVIGNLLWLVGFDINKVLRPLDRPTIFYTGRSDTFEFDFSINGTSGDDKIWTHGGQHTLFGGSGSDDLRTGPGNDTLDGGVGADRMSGGLGNDTYVVDNPDDRVIEKENEGTQDTIVSSVSFRLVANVENLVLTGAADINGSGNGLDNRIEGNSGNNALNGGGGDDLLLGGAGDDVYAVDSTLDIVLEHTGEGTDKVNATVSFTLTDNVENLKLLGTDAIDGTGNNLANEIAGNVAANVLRGHGGNDIISGNAGADFLYGDSGNDRLSGGADSDSLYGGVGVDTLQGGTGSDILDGGVGNDVLTGGADADTFVFKRGYGADRVTDFVVGIDKIDLRDVPGIANFSDVQAHTNANGVATINLGNGDALTLQNINLSQLHASDFIFGPSNSALIDRISLASDGSQANGESFGAEGNAISADGRYVVFSSYASNLVSDDTNGRGDVFVKDTVTGAVTRVSVSSAGAQGDGHSGGATISNDGRYVAFSSMAANLVSNDGNGLQDVFVHDLVTHQTQLVSTASDGTPGYADHFGMSGSFQPVISGNGMYIAFNSDAANLVAGDNNQSVDAFIKNLQTGETTLLSQSASGEVGNSFTYVRSISATGQFVVLDSNSSNLVDGDSNGLSDVFLKDMQTGEITLVSQNVGGELGNTHSAGGTISADGRFVAFLSSATNLVPSPDDPSTPYYSVFVYDNQTKQLEGLLPIGPATGGNVSLSASALSGDGRFLVFTSDANNVVPGDTDNFFDIFLFDRMAHSAERISTGLNGALPDDGSFTAAISPDGNSVIFSSAASNLVPNDSNGFFDTFLFHNDWL